MNFIDMIKILKENHHAKGVLGNVVLTATAWSGTVYQECNNLSEPLCFPALTASQILSEDWEIEYHVNEEPKLHTFEEALKALKEGKAITRKSTDDNSKLLLVNGRFIEKMDSGHQLPVYFYEPSDLLATDWVIIG